MTLTSTRSLVHLQSLPIKFRWKLIKSKSQTSPRRAGHEKVPSWRISLDHMFESFLQAPHIYLSADWIKWYNDLVTLCVARKQMPHKGILKCSWNPENFFRNDTDLRKTLSGFEMGADENRDETILCSSTALTFLSIQRFLRFDGRYLSEITFPLLANPENVNEPLPEIKISQRQQLNDSTKFSFSNLFCFFIHISWYKMVFAFFSVLLHLKHIF